MSMTTAHLARALANPPPPPDDWRVVHGAFGPLLDGFWRRLSERLFGKAAVVGFLSTFGSRRPLDCGVEIDPATGRETLLSLLTRRQREFTGR